MVIFCRLQVVDRYDPFNIHQPIDNVRCPQHGFQLSGIQLFSLDESAVKGRTIENASDFAMYLLEEAQVATVTGEAFGSPNCIRISYAASEAEIREAIRRIREAL